MGDARSQDNDLLNRLNALKKSHISLDTNGRASIPRPEKTPAADDLAARLKSLRAAAPPPSQQQAARSLAAFAAAPTWCETSPLPVVDRGAARDLLADARDVLARSKALSRSATAGDDPDLDADEERGVDDVLTSLVDEAELEQGRAADDGRGPTPTDGFGLPRVPSRDPLPPAAPDPVFESDMAARLAALRGPPTRPRDVAVDDTPLLPSAPTSAPGPPPPPRCDEETWCTICHDDAAVLCFGCGSGALYCVRCWKEGHLGPDVGGEERGHRWTRYRRP